MPQDYTPDRLSNGLLPRLTEEQRRLYEEGRIRYDLGVRPLTVLKEDELYNMYQDEWGVWHDTGGRPRPTSYVEATVQRAYMNAEEYSWYSQPQLTIRASPECMSPSTSRYSLPAGPWYYRIWVWCVVHLCT